MKQPRNILCDKSAATVFYKAEGGKNVQEPLPEKIMNLFLSSSPLVPTLAPLQKKTRNLLHCWIMLMNI